MASRFGWVDFAEDDRRKMLDVVHLFSERETRDELGTGSIRDAFADLFFPGTSTIQTRVKYMLLVPWMYLRLEGTKVPSAKIEARSRREEIQLIKALLNSGETDGVIGQDAKENLVRLPSSIYWAGLRSWGIRLFQGSQEQYHRSLDAFYTLRKTGFGGETDDELASTGPGPNWHPGLPESDKGFPAKVSLSLTVEQARFLQERVLLNHEESLLAHMLRVGNNIQADYPWQHPAVSSAGDRLQSLLGHARNFAEVIHGAALLYNLMLASKLENEEFIERYENRLIEWTAAIGEREADLQRWHRQIGHFWNSEAFTGDRLISPRTRKFVSGWLQLAIEQPGAGTIIENQAARRLIEMREWDLKRNRARLSNQNALKRWRGASGTEMLTYRWKTASTFVGDILEGLRGRRLRA